MSTQLIPVFNGILSNETNLLCNARDLHKFLGVGKRFASWVTERITEYGFVENQDYILISHNRETKIGRGGDRRSKEYHLTLDTAKELAMVERNEKGRQVRRYFIECEKQLKEATSSRAIDPHPIPRFRYLVTLTYKDRLTGEEKTFTGGANNPGEIVQGTAKRFGYYVTEMLDMPVTGYC